MIDVGTQHERLNPLPAGTTRDWGAVL
jgi:hypothetical protein